VILPTNTRRVVRALEVNEITGRPFQASLPKAGPELVRHLTYGLSPSLEDLDRRIAGRVAEMVAAGLVSEVARLSSRGLTLESQAGRAIGYRQFLEHLAGRLTLAEAVAATITATSQYARRQLRWFRADPRVHWLSPDDSEGLSTAAQILAHLGQHRA
jgi:tRNA dimethylallyltransferase